MKNKKLIAPCHSEQASPERNPLTHCKSFGDPSVASLLRDDIRVAFWRSQAGQTLVTLLVFTIVAITITSAAVVIILTNSIGTSKLEQGTNTFYSAESGAENAILRLLRDPNYAGETLAVDDANVVITVTNTGSTYTITSNATLGNFIRSVQVSATFVNNILAIDSWKEVF